MALGKNLTKRLSPLSTSEDSVKESEEDVAVLPEVEIAELEPETQEIEKHKMMCVFKTGGEEYAVPIDEVKEVVKLSAITPVPQMPVYIKGMVNVRGNIYSILDLATFFGNKENADEQFHFLVVINDEEYKVAIRIPSVPDALQVSHDMIENFSASMSKSIEKQEFLKGIIKKDKRMIILLNILDMISSDDFVS